MVSGYKRFVWLMIASVCTFSAIGIYFHVQSHLEKSSVSRPPIQLPEPTQHDHYDVLINSYMNSGSRFTGRFFGFRKDAFYVYEPLWRFSMLDFFHADNITCNTYLSEICREISVNETNKFRMKGFENHGIHMVSNIDGVTSTKQLLLKTLFDIYDCNFSAIGNIFHSRVHDSLEYAGRSWDGYRTCTGLRRPKEVCLTELEQVCKHATHRVTKVLRLTTGTMENLLKERPNLKIIHLFRDPRAILNSRLESRGYPVNTNNEVSRNSRILCRKMLWDVTGGMDLVRQFPNRVKFIFYGDLKDDLPSKLERLYNFVGMTQNEPEVTSLNQVKTNDPQHRNVAKEKLRKDDNANWWRSQMSLQYVRTVQSDCDEVVRLLKLRPFNDENELRNLSIPSRHADKMFDIL